MLNYTECVSFSWPWNDFSVEVWFDFQNASFKFIEYILIGRCESKTYVYTHWSVFRYCHRNMIKKPMQMHTWSHITHLNNVSNWIHKIVFIFSSVIHNFTDTKIFCTDWVIFHFLI